MNLAWRAKVELFKLGHYDKIPLHIDKDIGIFYFSPKQLEALEYLRDDITTSLGYGGGAFGGKSALLCYFLLLMCSAYPGTRWALGRKDSVRLKKTVLKTMFKVLKGEGFKDKVDYVYRSGQGANEIIFPNGSEILLINMAMKPSDPEFTEIGGLELTGACIDESNENNGKAIATLFTRIGRCKNYEYGIKKKLLETFNPDKGHVYRRFYLPWVKKEEKETRKFIRALPKDNPHPSTEEYIQGIIDDGNKVLIERLIHGNFDFDDDPMLLISTEAVNDLWGNNFVDEGEGRIVVDVSGQGRDLTVLKVYKGLVCVYREEEKKSTKFTVKELIQKVQRKFRIPDRQVIVDGNGVGGEVADIMPNVKRFIANKAPVMHYQKGNFGHYKDQCGFLLAEMVNDNLIWHKCTDNQDELKLQYSVLKRMETGDGKKRLIKKEDMKEILGGKSPDDLDCDIMLMDFELRPNYSARKWS